MIRIVVAGLVMMACGGGGTPKAISNPATVAGPAPYAVAVVCNGWEMWIGNDELPDLAKDDPSRYQGVLRHIKAAFEKVDLPRTAPQGSQGMLVTYADKPTIRIPMGPIANITQAAFGTQKDYFGSVGFELMTGLELATDELVKLPAGKKLIVVLSDGNDTNNETARSRLAKLKEQLAAQHIEVVSIVYKAPLSNEGNVIAALTSDTREAPSFETFEIDLVRALEQLGK